MSRFKSMSDVRQASAKSRAPYWFSPDTMRFFNSRIGRTLYGGRYFITSETPDWETPRRYTVREAMPDGTIDTVGEFRGHETNAAARAEIRRLLA